MRSIGAVLAVIALASSLGCVSAARSTARYEDAHQQRIADINARYAAERERLAAPAPAVAGTPHGAEALERDRQAEIAASAHQRDLEIADDRAAHRARVQANAFAAVDPAAVGASGRCADADGDQLLSGAAGCRPMSRPAPSAPAHSRGVARVAPAR